MQQTSGPKVDHCVVDPHFESMVWGYIVNPHADSAHGVRGELALWAKVIQQAFFDFCNTGNTSQIRNHRIAAKIWLLHDQKNFPFVCDLVGVNPRYVRSLIRRAIENEDARKLLSASVLST